WRLYPCPMPRARVTLATTLPLKKTSLPAIATGLSPDSTACVMWSSILCAQPEPGRARAAPEAASDRASSLACDLLLGICEGAFGVGSRRALGGFPLSPKVAPGAPFRQLKKRIFPTGPASGRSSCNVKRMDESSRTALDERVRRAQRGDEAALRELI